MDSGGTEVCMRIWASARPVNCNCAWIATVCSEESNTAFRSARQPHSARIHLSQQRLRWLLVL
eukprot:3824966-Amphidinium_carterae.1